MPVPTGAPTTAPRRLLRDIVHEKMYAAIIDGTLELGERLNDDELVAWLGVSRTPVREAIAKLADQALVDIEANRYTRVIAPSFAEFVDTFETGYAVWSLITKRGLPALSPAQRSEALAVLDARAKALGQGELEELGPLSRMVEMFVEATGSASLQRILALTAPRLVVLIRRVAAEGIFDFESSLAWTTELRDAIERGDAEAAAEVVREYPTKLGAYFERVRETGIYPEVARRP